jgi:hypothetical protein
MHTELPSRSKIAQIAWKRFLPFIVGLTALILYSVTAAPSLVALYDDSLEFQLVGPTFGIAHPTGYPLYTLLGGLWSRVIFPFGNWAWRMNLFSVVAGAAAIAVLFLLARRLAAGSPSSGTAAALAFALSPLWWSQTTVAEVYALHGLFVAVILWVAMADRRRQMTDDGRKTTDDGRKTKDDGRKTKDERRPNPTQHTTRITHDASRNSQLATRITHDALQITNYELRITHLRLLFFLLGLGLTHHRTTVLLVPGIVLYLLWTVPGIWRPQRAWIGWALAFLAPLLLYLYIPLRAAMGATDLEGAYVNTWTGFWDHVLARGYTGFFDDNPLAVHRSPADWLALFVAQFGWIGLTLGMVGIVIGLIDPRQRPSWVLVTVTLIVNLLFAVNYQVADAEIFAIPAFLCLALGIGKAVGCWQLAVGSRRDDDATMRQAQYPISNTQYPSPNTHSAFRIPHSALLITHYSLLLILAFFPLGRGPAVDRSDDWAVHNDAVALAKVDFPAGSQVVGLRGQMTALAYMQQAEGLGKDALPVAIDNPDARRAYVEANAEAGVPLFLTQELAGIEQRYSFSGDGPLVSVWPRGAVNVGAPQVAHAESLADGALHLIGYDLDRLDQPGGSGVRVAFYWQPTRPVDRVLKLSLRLLDAGGQVLTQEDRFPLRQVALTTHWLPGEVVRDVHDLPLPATARQLLVILYDAETVAEVGRFSIQWDPLQE